MKILAMEIEPEGIKPSQYKPYLKAEVKRVWELYQNGKIRELYFRADGSETVLMLECTDINEAQQTLASLPLVQPGLITSMLFLWYPSWGLHDYLENKVAS